MINVDFRGTGFPEDIMEGEIQIRYIPEHGLCLCACWNEEWYYIPMIGTKSTEAYENKISTLNRQTEKIKADMSGNLKKHNQKSNPHGTYLGDLTDLGQDATYSLRNGSSIQWSATDGKFKISDLNNSVVNKTDIIPKVVNTVASFDFASSDSQVFEINVTGVHATDYHTISSIANARVYEHYTFINNSTVAGNKVKFSVGATMHLPKGVDLTLEYRDTVRFYAQATDVLICIAHGNNST